MWRRIALKTFVGTLAVWGSFEDVARAQSTAAVSTFTDRAAWEAASQSITTVTFEGILPSPEGAEVYREVPLILSGVTFSGSFDGGYYMAVVGANYGGTPFDYNWGSGATLQGPSHSPILFAGGPNPKLRITLPPGTTSFGTDLMSYRHSDTELSLTLSTGETFTQSTLPKPARAFLGVISDVEIAYVDIKPPVPLDDGCESGSLTADCPYPSVDNVSVGQKKVAPPSPCTYTFTSGSGAALISHCVSANGTLVKLTAPAGQQHIDVGQVWEGYVVCTGTTVQDWDLQATADGFGVPTVISGPTGSSVTLRRLSSRYQLDQAFRIDKPNKAVEITMTLTNISGAAIPDVRIARAYDPDVNNDFGDDLEIRSARGTWAGDVDAVTLTGTTWGFPTDTAIDTAASASCSPSGAVSPTTTGDASLANVTYRVGTMAAGAKKKVVFVYRMQ